MQRPGQLQVRASAQRRLDIVPFFVGRPVRILELMLDVEQPDARHRREVVRHGRRRSPRSATRRANSAPATTSAMAAFVPQTLAICASPVAMLAAAEPLADHEVNRSAEQQRRRVAEDAIHEAAARRAR